MNKKIIASALLLSVGSIFAQKGKKEQKNNAPKQEVKHEQTHAHEHKHEAGMHKEMATEAPATPAVTTEQVPTTEQTQQVGSAE
jgi:hypothetical protein